MPIATWQGAVLADSDTYEVVEGNIYFPPQALNREYFQKSQSKTVCPWKGAASYYDVVVAGNVNQDAAWTYPSPSKAARNIKNHIAFQYGIKVEKKPGESGPEPGGFLAVLRRIFKI